MKSTLKDLPFWKILLTFFVLLPILIVTFMLVWNSTIPDITGWTEINFFEAAVVLWIGHTMSIFN